MRAVAGGPYWKSVVATVGDALLVGAAFTVAHHLRFGGLPPDGHQELMARALPAVIAFKVCVFYGFHLYNGIWRHAGTPEVMRLAGASTVASAGVAVGLTVFGAGTVAPSVLVIDALLTTVAVGGTRFGFRALRQYFAAQQSGGRRVLIYGTGGESMLALRHLRRTDGRKRTAVGFLADNADETGLRLQGLTVLGTPDDLPRLAREHDLDEIIVPTAPTTRESQRALRDAAARHDLGCRFFSMRLAPTPPGQTDSDVHPASSESSGDGAWEPVDRGASG